MSYMQELEQQLHDRLQAFAAGDLSAQDFVVFIKKTVLESYHNGQKAGPQAPRAETGAAPARRFYPRAKGTRGGDGKPSAGRFTETG